MNVNSFPVNMRIIEHNTVILDYYNISKHSFENVRPAPQQFYIDFFFVFFLLSTEIFKYLAFYCINALFLLFIFFKFRLSLPKVII